MFLFLTSAVFLRCRMPSDSRVLDNDPGLHTRRKWFFSTIYRMLET
jgi:hypothetical protein